MYFKYILVFIYLGELYTSFFYQSFYFLDNTH